MCVINAYFNAKLMGIDYDLNKKLYYEELHNVTLQDITNFEKQNIVGKPYRMVILGDEKESRYEEPGEDCANQAPLSRGNLRLLNRKKNILNISTV